jgi:ABC-type transporter Mla subunit MlaD
MARSMKDKIKSRISELNTEMDQAMQVYNDKDQEIARLNQELSDRMRDLRNERGNLAIQAAKCQQTINELKGLLDKEGGEA